jgi:hypothetical protein
VKCRTEIKVLILYFNLCLSVMLDPMEIQFWFKVNDLDVNI